MRNTKNQDPKSRKAPASKLQYAPAGSESNGAPAISAVWILQEGTETKRPLHPFDLEERTAQFGERIIGFAKRMPRGPAYPENNRLIDQMVGCGTSVGANYCEANDSFSRKDFKFVIKRCLKEAKEARFFLRMIAASERSLADEARELYREANELVRIFAAMYRK